MLRSDVHGEIKFDTKTSAFLEGQMLKYHCSVKVVWLGIYSLLRKFYNRPIGFRGCFSGIIFFTKAYDRNFWRLDKNVILLHWPWATQAFFIRRNHVASFLTDKNNLSIQLFQSFNLLPLFTDVWISNCFSYKLREDL